MSPKLKNFIVTIILCFVGAVALAQDPPAPTRMGGIPPPVGIPIDTSLVVLMLAGVVLGVVVRLRVLGKSKA